MIYTPLEKIPSETLKALMQAQVDKLQRGAAGVIHGSPANLLDTSHYVKDGGRQLQQQPSRTASIKQK